MAEGIILAGGRSERLDSFGVPKQFAEIGGVPLIMCCLESFEKCNDIDGYVIVAEKSWRGKLRKWLDDFGAVKFRKFALPGDTRQHSVYNGLLAVQPFSPDRVVVHDAARPLITDAFISECIAQSKADGFDGATPALPMSDTVYRSTNGQSITHLLNRDEILAGQTPECYDFSKYLKAHEALSDEEIGAIRGSSEIAFKAGMNIKLFEGERINIKITTIEDVRDFIHIVDDIRRLNEYENKQV